MNKKKVITNKEMDILNVNRLNEERLNSNLSGKKYTMNELKKVDPRFIDGKKNIKDQEKEMENICFAASFAMLRYEGKNRQKSKIIYNRDESVHMNYNLGRYITGTEKYDIE